MIAHHRQKARQQAEQVAWAILADWIKAQVAMMVAGFINTDAPLLSHFQLSDGRRVGQSIISVSGMPADDLKIARGSTRFLADYMPDTEGSPGPVI